MNYLEEVIEEKDDMIALLEKQIAALTTSDAGSEGNANDPGTLKRQLLKMERTMKVRFECMKSMLVGHFEHKDFILCDHTFHT